MKEIGEYLFEASSENIGQSLSEIGTDDIQDCCDYQIFKRGEAYYRDGMVQRITHKPRKNVVKAKVDGTELYKLEFSLDQEEVWATCDCLYDDVCKHMVAVLLQIANQGIETVPEAPQVMPSKKESLEIIRKSLKTLSKKELTGLVMKYAPVEYLEEIRNRNAPEIDSAAIFKKAEKEIRRCFKDDELLYDPVGMEAALRKNLLKLKGLEKDLQNEIGELLLFTIRSVDRALDEGYLYLDDWYDDSFFESDEICEYIIAYVNQLPFDLKHIYIIQLDHELNEMSNDTFYAIENSYHRFFGKNEKEKLARLIEQDHIIPETLVSRLYDFLESGLNDEERESLLKKIIDVDQKHVTALCEIYMNQKRYQENYDLILEHIPEQGRYADENLVLTYLEVANKLGHHPVELSIKALNWKPSLQVLEMIKKLFGSVDQEGEIVVRDRAPEALLTFYEKEDRLEDALLLAVK